MLGNEIREQLASYVLKELSLESFEDWFVAASWNAQSSEDQETKKLVYAVEALLAEFSGGHIEEAILRSRLSQMAERYTVNVDLGAAQTVVHAYTGTSQLINSAIEVQIRLVDIQPSMAFV